MKTMSILLIGLIFLSVPAGLGRAQPEENGISHYTCGMHPSVNVSPEEYEKGNQSCPICHMDLVPIYKETEVMGQEGGPSVRLTERQISLAGVQTEEIIKRHLFKEIYTVGRIAYDPKLRIAQEEYLQALKMSQKARSSSFPEVSRRANELLESTSIKLRVLGMSAQEISELEKRQSADRSLILPEEKAWVYADIYEYDFSWVNEGVKVTVSTDAYPGEEFIGIVTSIEPVVDPKTRSVRIRAELDNPELKLKPEMYVNVFIHVMLMDEEGTHGEVLAVPKTAILDTGLRKVVYVDLGDGRFLGRDVELGPEAVSFVGDKKERFCPVISGLKENEKVVTRANFLIDSQSQLIGSASGAYGGALEHKK